MNEYEVESNIYMIWNEVKRLSKCISDLERKIASLPSGGGGGSTPTDITATATATTVPAGTPASASVTVS